MTISGRVILARETTSLGRTITEWKIYGEKDRIGYVVFRAQLEV